MSKVLYSSAVITINSISTEKSSFVNVSEISSTSDKKVLRVTSHNNSKLSFKEYDCRISNRKTVDMEKVDILTITNGSASLSELPKKITDITFVMKSPNFPTNMNLNDKNLFYDALDGEVAIIQVTYVYESVEVDATYNKSSSGFVTFATASNSFKPESKAILYTTCEEASTFTELAFVNELPDLTESHEVVDSEVLFRLYSVSGVSLNSIEFLWSGGAVVSTVFDTEDITETIEIKSGYGYTSKNIEGIYSYEFIEGYGNINPDFEESKNNRVSFKGTGDYSNIKEAIVNITYSTKVKKYTCTLSNNTSFYKFSDLYNNVISGSIEGFTEDKKDIELEVYDHLSKEPVPFALVEIAGKKYTTDANGLITIKGLSKGKYLVKISKNGYINNLYDFLDNEWIYV